MVSPSHFCVSSIFSTEFHRKYHNGSVFLFVQPWNQLQFQFRIQNIYFSTQSISMHGLCWIRTGSHTQIVNKGIVIRPSASKMLSFLFWPYVIWVGIPIKKNVPRLSGEFETISNFLVFFHFGCVFCLQRTEPHCTLMTILIFIHNIREIRFFMLLWCEPKMTMLWFSNSWPFARPEKNFRFNRKKVVKLLTRKKCQV